MKRTILLTGAVSFVMAFLGAALAVTLAIPAAVGAQEARIRAEQFATIGDNGADRIHLGTGPGGRASVQVLAADGSTPRVTLATGGSLAEGGTNPRGAGIDVFALDGTQVVRLGTTGPNTLGVQLRLRDQAGRDRVQVSVAEDGTPAIELLDADGYVTWSAR
jgi:hypothetical protein